MTRENQLLQEELAEIYQQYRGVHALSWDEAKELRRTHGLNTLSVGKQVKWYRLLMEAFVSPFNAILAVLAAISASTGDYRTMAILLIMLTFGSLLRFYQEWKSNIAAASLTQLVDNRCAAIR